jgi:hypothetical protein
MDLGVSRGPLPASLQPRSFLGDRPFGYQPEAHVIDKRRLSQAGRVTVSPHCIASWVFNLLRFKIIKYVDDFGADIKL